MQESRLVRYFLLPLCWSLALGAAGFMAGFIGPMVFSPEANQGPMLGLFITGPGGVVLGGVIGFICAHYCLAWRRQVMALGATATLGGGAILLFCLISPSI